MKVDWCLSSFGSDEGIAVKGRIDWQRYGVTQEKMQVQEMGQRHKVWVPMGLICYEFELGILLDAPAEKVSAPITRTLHLNNEVYVVDPLIKSMQIIHSPHSRFGEVEIKMTVYDLFETAIQAEVFAAVNPREVHHECDF